MKSNPVIFLDRDGVINKSAKPHEYITSWQNFVILPGVYEALKLFHFNGYKIFIATNQRCISRRIASQSQIDELHARMTENFALNGCNVDGIFICPHGDDDNCNCRKPKPGLLMQAQNWLESSCGLTVDKQRSWMIGDTKTDELAGISYGVNTVLIRDEPPAKFDGMKHLTAENILAAARKILDLRNT